MLFQLNFLQLIVHQDNNRRLVTKSEVTILGEVRSEDSNPHDQLYTARVLLMPCSEYKHPQIRNSAEIAITIAFTKTVP